MSLSVAKCSMSMPPLSRVWVGRVIQAALAGLMVVMASCVTTPTETVPLTRSEDKTTSPVVRELLALPVVVEPEIAKSTIPVPETSPGVSVEAGPGVSVEAGPGVPGVPQGSKSAATRPARGSPKAPKGRKAPGAAIARSDAWPGAAPTLALAAPSGSSGTPGSPAPPQTAAQTAIPPGTLYVCSAVVNGQNQQTAIEFEPHVKTLCARHPEMGVCQYERDQCRLAGGRVYTATGEEITRYTEAEYDKKVLRVRFKAG